MVVIDIPAGGRRDDMIRVSGIRVPVAGTGITSLSVNISMEGNTLLSGQGNVTVINSVAPAIRSFTAAECVVDARAVPATVQGQLTIRESFVGAFIGSNQITPDMRNGTEFRLLIKGLVPGVDIRIDDDLPHIKVAKRHDLREGETVVELVLLESKTDQTNVITVPYQVILEKSLPERFPVKIEGALSLAPNGTAFAGDDAEQEILSEGVPRYMAHYEGPLTMAVIR